MIKEHKQFNLPQPQPTNTGIIDSGNIYRLDKDLIVKKSYELNEKEFRNSVGQKIGRVSVSGSTYTTATNEYLIAVTSLALAPTIGLPRPYLAGVGKTYIVKDEVGGATTTTITVRSVGEENIDGSSTSTITTNYGSKKYYSNGTNWFTI